METLFAEASGASTNTQQHVKWPRPPSASRPEDRGPTTARRALPRRALHPPPSPGEFSDSSCAISTHRLYVFVSPKSFSAFDYIPVFLPTELSLADHGPAKRRRRARACGATRRMRTADRPRGSCVLQVSVVDEKVPQSK